MRLRLVKLKSISDAELFPLVKALRLGAELGTSDDGEPCFHSCDKISEEERQAANDAIASVLRAGGRNSELAFIVALAWIEQLTEPFILRTELHREIISEFRKFGPQQCDDCARGAGHAASATRLLLRAVAAAFQREHAWEAFHAARMGQHGVPRAEVAPPAPWPVEIEHVVFHEGTPTVCELCSARARRSEDVRARRRGADARRAAGCARRVGRPPKIPTFVDGPVSASATSTGQIYPPASEASPVAI